MAWKDFAASNKRGTCVWCGHDLRTCPRDRNKRGEYGDNLFCNLRCGYQFGLTLARAGKRLARDTPQNATATSKKPQRQEPEEDDDADEAGGGDED